VDHRADIFALGVLMYELLTGRLPTGRFEGPSRFTAVNQSVDRVIFKALDHDPALRFQTVDEFHGEVKRSFSGRKIAFFQACGDLYLRVFGVFPRKIKPGDAGQERFPAIKFNDAGPIVDSSFCHTVALQESEIPSVNQVLVKAFNQYLELENRHTRSYIDERSRRLTVIHPFENELAGLEASLSQQLGKILSSQRFQGLHLAWICEELFPYGRQTFHILVNWQGKRFQIEERSLKKTGEMMRVKKFKARSLPPRYARFWSSN
jgi:serine/threonine protein kinase